MLLKFCKYHGIGNDFIIIDNRMAAFPDNDKVLVSRLCNRRTGIGADGLILLNNAPGYDFRMVYYNADGMESSMCGNGGRCIAKFAASIGLITDKAAFLAIDGEHQAVLHDSEVCISMRDVAIEEVTSDHCVMDTGSPHYLQFRENIEDIDLLQEARKIRYSSRFKNKGVNINFLEWKNDILHIRTYERGVENETLSCGTGMVAAALYAAVKGDLPAPYLWSGKNKNECKLSTKGGTAKVNFIKASDNSFNGIRLTGPAEFVFKGEIDV